MKTIAITGGTGFVGKHLSEKLVAAGRDVVIFSRSSRPPSGNIHYADWNPDNKTIDRDALRNVNAVIHLAGAGVTDKRWSPARKKEIVRSRVDATEFLISQLKLYAPDCSTFISASATGYYGPDKRDHIFTETDPPYEDFLANVCTMWEKASLAAETIYRRVIFRFGIVLGKDGGAYKQLAAPMNFGIVPIIGGGRQNVSWVHVEDVCGMIMCALEDTAYSGIYNSVAPIPVSNRTMMLAFAKAKGGLKIPALVPGFLLKLIMGEASVEVLKSCTASAEKIEAQGYRFQFPTIEMAAKELDGK